MKPCIIKLDTNSAISKYRQIINSVVEAVNKGDLKQGDKIPSINQVCKKWNLSRDTVVNAYNELKSLGIVSSAPGKGYYIESINVKLTNNIFVLFDELNSFKEDLYNTFLENLNRNSQVDIYFHHFNRKLFDKLISESKGHYTTYVIMPARFRGTSKTLDELNGRVIILDQLPEDIPEKYPAIYQNFEKDTFSALSAAASLIGRYNKLTMIFPGGKEPEGMVKGFTRFCTEARMSHEVINNTEGVQITAGEAYLVISDRHLVWLVKRAKAAGLQPGKDIGIISYNDTALKEVVGNGITTISTDFREMGRILAKLVSEKRNTRIENTSSLIVRDSL